jgi:paraquat-inducible protein A
MPAIDVSAATASASAIIGPDVPAAPLRAAPAVDPTPMLACLDCDLLQEEIALPRHGSAFCVRCGARMYRDTPNGLERTLALALASAVLFAVANAFPLITLELQGSRSTTGLFGAAHALYMQDMFWLAALVFTTTILVPAIEIVSMMYLLVPLRLGVRLPGTVWVLRFVQSVRPWGMVEVFMLGVLVSVVKLASFATIHAGVAMWSVAGVMLLQSAMADAFNPRDVWARLHELPA